MVTLELAAIAPPPTVELLLSMMNRHESACFVGRRFHGLVCWLLSLHPQPLIVLDGTIQCVGDWKRTGPGAAGTAVVITPEIITRPNQKALGQAGLVTFSLRYHLPDGAALTDPDPDRLDLDSVNLGVKTTG
jgi:hypothetical protein